MFWRTDLCYTDSALKDTHTQRLNMTIQRAGVYCAAYIDICVYNIYLPTYNTGGTILKLLHNE